VNRAQRRAAGHKMTCHDCDSIHIASKADYGWLCLPCLDKRNERLDELVMGTGMMLAQNIDPDGPPVPCSEVSCQRDATVIVKVRASDGMGGFYGCNAHNATAIKAAQKYLERTK
jgi:hypothetical protein